MPGKIAFNFNPDLVGLSRIGSEGAEDRGRKREGCDMSRGDLVGIGWNVFKFRSLGVEEFKS